MRLLFGMPVHADGRQAVAIVLPTPVACVLCRRSDNGPVVTEAASAVRVDERLHDLQTLSPSVFERPHRQTDCLGVDADYRHFANVVKIQNLNGFTIGIVLRQVVVRRSSRGLRRDASVQEPLSQFIGGQ